jgi:hypothetical protein
MAGESREAGNSQPADAELKVGATSQLASRRISSFDFRASNFEFRVFLKVVIHGYAPEYS